MLLQCVVKHGNSRRGVSYPIYMLRNIVSYFRVQNRKTSPSRQFAISCSSNQLQSRSFEPLIAPKKLEGETVRIGCASGFWGDTSVAAPQLVHDGNLDFLVFDYLSEITMSLLVAARQKSPEFGYAPDFVQFAIGPLLRDIKQKGIRIVSNAGGINPHACAAALTKACQKASVELNIAVVTGDDLMPQSEDVKTYLKQFNMKLPRGVHSMNAYLGAGPIARALDLGADVVVTGRCVDSALALGPILHSFKWPHDDYDLLASGSLAGHLIECGAQVTGGIFTDWETVPDWDNIGFPIVEVAKDGTFLVSKPPNTGGVVNKATVAEQLVYEIGDPKRYLLPDVICDFSEVTLQPFFEEDQRAAVLVTGAKGNAPTTSYKVSATHMDGFRVLAVCPVIGPHAGLKGQRTAESIFKRCSSIFKRLGLEDFTQTHIEILGSEHNYGHNASTGALDSGPREVVLWMGAQHKQKQALEIFSREIAPAGTGMAPGLTTLIGGRPKVSPLLRLHSLLYPKDKVKIVVSINGEHKETYCPPVITEGGRSSSKQEEPAKIPKPRLLRGNCTFPLGALAYTRSGDKGNTANIGVICRNPGFYPFLSHALTAQKVEDYFKHLFEGEKTEFRVTRYDLPGISAFNFVLENALGGGGVASLRSDPQGKALGQMLLDFKVKNMPDLMPSTAERMTENFKF